MDLETYLKALYLDALHLAQEGAGWRRRWREKHPASELAAQAPLLVGLLLPDEDDDFAADRAQLTLDLHRTFGLVVKDVERVKDPASEAAYARMTRRAEVKARAYARMSLSMIRRHMYAKQGVTRFRWRTRGDDRVRDEHRQIAGRVFSIHKGHPLHGFPGEAPGCRCEMEPVGAQGVLFKGGLRKAGPYIGPKGGKWADPQHTIPWDPDKHEKQPAQEEDDDDKGAKKKPEPEKDPKGKPEEEKPKEKTKPPSLVEFETLLRTKFKEARALAASLGIKGRGHADLLEKFRAWSDSDEAQAWEETGVDPRTKGKDGDGKPKDERIAQGDGDIPLAKVQAKAAHMALERFTSGTVVVAEDGQTYTRTKDGWTSQGGEELDTLGLMERLTEQAMIVDGKDSRLPYISLLWVALKAFVEGAVPGRDPHFIANLTQEAMSGKPAPLSGKARRALEAALSKLDLEDLAKVEGGQAARWDELVKRSEEVAAQVGGLMQRHGLSPIQTFHAVSALLDRMGWEGEARAVFLSMAIENKTLGTSMIAHMQAAENLARKEARGGGRAGSKVRAEHVKEVAGLAGLGADEGKPWDEAVKALGEDAEKEVKAVYDLIQKAKSASTPEERRRLLSQATASPAINKLRKLWSAFPDTADKALSETDKALGEAEAASPKATGKGIGSEARVKIPGAQGQARTLNARYRVMEAHEVIPSHDAETFSAHASYPDGLQERAYHKDKAEQRKVIMNAQRLDPDFVINTNPTATDGPPMITRDGLVLGGNSRAMSTQRAYRKHPERAEAYRKQLEAQAAQFGIDPEHIKGMSNPILVREVDVDDPSPEGMGLLVRQMNENFTQRMDRRVEYAAQARKIDADVINSIAENIGPDESLAQFLSTDRSDDFQSHLSRVGIIDGRNESEYTSKKANSEQRKVNEEGRKLVERVLVGHLVSDGDLMSRMDDDRVDVLSRSALYIMKAASYGEGFDLSHSMRVAIDAHTTLQHLARETGAFKALGPKSTDEEIDGALGMLHAQGSLLGQHEVFTTPHARKLLHVLIKKPNASAPPAGTPKHESKQMAGVFRDIADVAVRGREDQGALFGGPSPHDLIDQVLNEHLGWAKKEEPPSAPDADEDDAKPSQTDDQTISLF